MDICSGMTEAEVASLEEHLKRIEMPANTVLFREGEPGDRLYLLARGEITVSMKLPGRMKRNRRLGTYSPGVMLGEMAVLEGKARSADAVVVSNCVLYTIDGPGLERMQIENPGLYSQFMLNLTRQLIGRLRGTTLELRAAYS
jgi:CRP-like cAMP-binding protein